MAANAIPQVSIVFASEIDVAATVRVVNAAFRTHVILTADRTSDEDIANELWPGTRFIQICEGDELAATAAVSPGLTLPALLMDDFPGIEATSSLYFGMAAVKPERMGHRLGARLLAEAEALARAEGFVRVILTTMEEMGNVAYYSRFGYRTVSVRELRAGYGSLVRSAHLHGMVKPL